MTTSPSAKLDPSLTRELAAAQARGESDKRIPIVIELARPLRTSGTRLRRQTVESVERRSHRLQEEVVGRLIELGAHSIQRASIVNAVSAELRPPEVLLIAAHPDVRIVRLARPEQVTTV